MSEMTDRVAQAIRDVNETTAGLTFNELAEAMARAAIEAMREPTEGMTYAAQDICVGFSGEYGERNEYCDPAVAKDVWSAMISAALT